MSLLFRFPPLAAAPTYATWDPAHGQPTNNNLTVTNLSGFNLSVAASSNMPVPTTGKWYWEVTTTNGAVTGISDSVAPNISNPGEGTVGNAWVHSAGWNAITQSWSYGGMSASGWTGVTVVSGSKLPSLQFPVSVVQYAVDMDNGALYMGADGQWGKAGNITTCVPTSGAAKTGALITGLIGKSVYAAVTLSSAFSSGGLGAQSATANFGQSAFTYPVPAGYNSGLY